MISTQLNGDILKPQFVEQLNYLRDKSKSLPEKEKCDHLSACLTISSKLGSDVKPFRPADKTPQRPKTAMAALGGNLWNPYETSMNRDYPQKVSPQTIAVRPKISKSYRNPYYLCDPIGISMYSDEFGCKPHSTTEPIRAATSSGARNHRPHPDKTFAAWRLPHQEKKMTEDSRSSCIKPLSIAEVQRVMASQYLSTYKRDYLGIPQGYRIKYDTPPDCRKAIPKPLNTECRFQYQVQPCVPELEDVTHKYGCYSTRHRAVKGVVPTVTYAHIQNQQNRTQLTTYERHFGKEYVDLSGLVASLDPAEMAGYLQSVPNEERRMLEKFLKAFQQNDNQHLETKSTQTKLN
ncbi:PREDICTED: testis-expressed sequence 26 protein isoform X1 [Nanorana parkeri]|uniref:testis-expressed sequence 26 protein isoform X1 n=1 Tax=Nanorana parkeri TaxID=125878 RepID=UPI000854A852|nr:PREDICTED: testis-expressed sequence 26 protein isoform X1 [Nanorana parkeri]